MPFVLPPLSEFPDASLADYDFKESSWFATQPERPLPDPRDIDFSPPQSIIRLEDLHLFIKQGESMYVGVSEALTLWGIRRAFGDQLRVPEVYGWRVRGDHTLIYMELIDDGVTTLRERWDSLSEAEKALICGQLRDTLTKLRQLQVHATDRPFIGSIERGPMRDRLWELRPITGPFDTLHDFYKHMEWIPTTLLPDAHLYPDPILSYLPANSPIVFTHSDFNPVNILVAAEGPPALRALIDWGQSAWLPDWWEYFKMCYTTDWEHDWRAVWFPRMLTERPDEMEVMSEYCMLIGAV